MYKEINCINCISCIKKLGRYMTKTIQNKYMHEIYFTLLCLCMANSRLSLKVVKIYIGIKKSFFHSELNSNYTKLLSRRKSFD